VREVKKNPSVLFVKLLNSRFFPLTAVLVVVYVEMAAYGGHVIWLIASSRCRNSVSGKSLVPAVRLGREIGGFTPREVVDSRFSLLRRRRLEVL